MGKQIKSMDSGLCLRTSCKKLAVQPNTQLQTLDICTSARDTAVLHVTLEYKPVLDDVCSLVL
jgi:hypothetical protein